MLRYKVYFKTSADKVFANLPKELQQRIVEALFRLSKNPFLRNLNIKKLSGFADAYRMRIGRWRILYNLKNTRKEMEIVDIFFKKGKEDYARRLRAL